MTLLGDKEMIKDYFLTRSGGAGSLAGPGVGPWENHQVKVRPPAPPVKHIGLLGLWEFV